METKSKGYDQKLFPKEFLSQFPVLKLSLKKKKGSEREVSGAKHSMGSSLDFLGYAPYTPGDDMRYIDWNVYARLDQLIVKQFHLSPCPSILILIDSSASMSIGKPSKFHASCRLAAILGYLFQQNGYSIRFAFLCESKVHYSQRFFYGQSWDSMLSFLSWRTAQGKIMMETIFSSVSFPLPKSYIFLCSDLLSAQNSQTSLAHARARGHEITLLHILAPEEISPPLYGTVRLKDIEGKEQRLLNIDDKALLDYNKSFQNFKNHWACFCRKHSIQYIFYSFDDWKDLLDVAKVF